MKMFVVALLCIPLVASCESEVAQEEVYGAYKGGRGEEASELRLNANGTYGYFIEVAGVAEEGTWEFEEIETDCTGVAVTLAKFASEMPIHQRQVQGFTFRCIKRSVFGHLYIVWQRDLGIVLRKVEAT